MIYSKPANKTESLQPFISSSPVVKQRLKPQQLIDFLDLSGQLLANGFNEAAIFQMAYDLKLLSLTQYQAAQSQLANGADYGQALAQICSDQELLMQVTLAAQQGNLTVCCQENSKLLRSRQQQLRQLRQLLTYPLLLLAMLLVMAAFVRFYLRPQILQLVPENQQAQGLGVYGWVIFVGLILVGLCAWLRWRRRSRLQQLRRRLRWPILGKVWRDYTDYLLYTDLAQLIASGLPLQDILTLLITTVPQSLQGQVAALVQLKLQAGQPLATVIQEEPLLPRKLTLLLAQSRPRAFQGAALKTLAQQSYQRLDQRLQHLIDQVQPLLFVVIALMITRLYLQILLPMYHMMKGF